MVIRSFVGKGIVVGLTVGAGLAGVVSAVCAAPNAHSSSAMPDAFMPVPATSVAAIVRQVQQNPVLRSRYARQLHVPEARVAQYLQANLVKSRLRSTGRYTMYCVRTNGLVYPALTTMPKGSAVFALRGGPPVMSYPEGNPLTRFRPVVITHVFNAPSKGPIVNVSPSQEMITPVQGQEIIVPAYVPTVVYQSTPAPADAPPAPPVP